MKKTMVKALILGTLMLSANAAFPRDSVRFDGGGPIPTCDPDPLKPCPK